jgi:ABC-type multidrug transport system ATPase subunit
LNAIELDCLTKRFGDFTAVDSVSFTVAKGTIFGFLGPNGSGKGLLQPTSGTARVLGYDVTEDPEAVKASIGYMNQAFSLYRDLSVEENLTFFGRIYGLTGERLARRKREVTEVTGLGPYLKRLSGKLSGGWKQRLALAAALIHEPELIFLDEPTAGIDPVARRDLWDLLFDLAGQGKTLFVTTHYMDEAERCGQIAYIYLSKLMVHGTPDQLKALPEVTPAGTRRIAILSSSAPLALACLKHQPFTRDATLVEAEVHLLLDTGTSDEQVRKILETVCSAIKIRAIEPSLEDVFVTLTRRFGAA